MPLTQLQIKNIDKPGKYQDGNGLYLNVSKTLSKSWVFRYQLHKKRTDLGLGSFNDLSLKEARDQVAKYRKMITQGIDPKIHKEKQKHRLQVSREWTFERCAAKYIEIHSPSWKNPKHRQQWANTITQYANPSIGKLPVDAITLNHIFDLLEPIWLNKNETAKRLRGRIEHILSWAIVRGYRPHPNPAVWRGNLSELLPAPNKVQNVKHHEALPYSEMPEFWARLANHTGVSVNCLRWTILHACRTNEAIRAIWGEVNGDIWEIPADRMKAGRIHKAPLSTGAIELFKTLPRIGDFMFPSLRRKNVNGQLIDWHLSDNSMRKLVQQDMGYEGITVHGFRSTFKDWAVETTDHPESLSEAALAHVIRDKTQAAYQRGDLLDKRRKLMQDWCDFVTDR